MFCVVVTLLLVSSLTTAFKTDAVGYKQVEANTECPEGFVRYGDLCLFNGTNKVTWYEALNICTFVLKEDAFLLEIYHFPVEFVKATGLEEHWVGGNNIRNNSQYVWTKTGNMVADWLWDENEPNNVGGWEHCTEFRHNGRLNDNDCHAYRMYYCAVNL